MPGASEGDWINSPLTVIQNIFDENGSNDSALVKEYFAKQLKSPNALSWVPSLNDTPLHNLRPNSLVRYRCMVQDMFDPEFYLGAYEVLDTRTNTVCIESGKYKDIAECLSHQRINLESTRNVTLDRQTLYCIPIPGETEWVKTTYSDMNFTKVYPSSSTTPQRCKRPLEEDEDLEGAWSSNAGQRDLASARLFTTQGDDLSSTDAEMNFSNTVLESTTQGSVSNSTPDLNFPLPGETGVACLVKLYDGIDSFKVNDMVEFVGVLSVDPSLAHFHETASSNEQTEGMVVGSDFEEPIEEKNAHAPPPSLVPRLHVVLSYKLEHNNPHLPISVAQDEFNRALSRLQLEITSLRAELLFVFEHALFGDSLAAEYLLCHLLASVYGRVDVMPMGKLSINFSNCPSTSVYSQLIHQLLSALVTKCHLLPISLHNMNNLRFSPRKDYTANRLQSGLLQLSSGTELVIDEMALQQGQLNPDGVKNIQALGNLITWQKVEYDFSYHRQDFHANVSILTLSEGKSILPSDCLVPLCQKIMPENLRLHFTFLDPKLTPDFLTKVRTYLGLTKLLSYCLTEDIQKVIQDDFVELRKNDTKNMTVDDFHLHLNLVRLMSLSHLQTTPDLKLWRRVKAMERERKCRVAQTPTSSPSS
ncbi:hypothetical protein CHS0354_006350 [Potamilus streckersoni]|uniref:Mini-chromosome maintenance complex-binding protein n=1 Tax=Potamilus streckersoni TaxID=2493646 RepID=A0AAE0SVA1_9BIVA|nr:hypothetical protein CHS0354_006350 [Potamilus streckersoni]